MKWYKVEFDIGDSKYEYGQELGYRKYKDIKRQVKECIKSELTDNFRVRNIKFKGEQCQK